MKTGNDKGRSKGIPLREKGQGVLPKLETAVFVKSNWLNKLASLKLRVGQLRVNIEQLTVIQAISCRRSESEHCEKSLMVYLKFVTGSTHWCSCHLCDFSC